MEDKVFKSKESLVLTRAVSHARKRAGADKAALKAKVAIKAEAVKPRAGDKRKSPQTAPQVAAAQQLFINRELGLLSFQRRVLAQAEDPRNPVLERLKFLCIVSNNLDEFFEIRVAGLRAQLRLNAGVTGPDGINLLIFNGNSGHIVTGANILYSVGGTTSTTDLIEYIDNTNGSVIDNGGNVMLHTVGPVMLDGALVLEVDNFNGGTINNGANVTAHFVGDLTDTAGQFHSLNWYVLNGSGFFNPTATGGTIGTGGNINVTFDGNASTTGSSDTGSIAAEIQNGNGGSIGTGGNISMTVGGNLSAGPLFLITENQGGHIGTGGNMTLNVSGDITTQGDADFAIFNNDNGNGPGTMGSNATINVSATNISTAGILDAEIDNYSGGQIGGSAMVNLTTFGDLTSQGTAFLQIVNNGSGHIGGNAILDVGTEGDFGAGGDLFARIYNDGGGFIGGDAKINFSAGSISIGGSDMYPFAILNLNGGHIVGDAEVNVIAGSLTGNSIHASIDNHDGGVIGLNAAVNLNVAT